MLPAFFTGDYSAYYAAAGYGNAQQGATEAITQGPSDAAAHVMQPKKKQGEAAAQGKQQRAKGPVVVVKLPLDAVPAVQPKDSYQDPGEANEFQKRMLQMMEGDKKDADKQARSTKALPGKTLLRGAKMSIAPARSSEAVDAAADASAPTGEGDPGSVPGAKGAAKSSRFAAGGGASFIIAAPTALDVKLNAFTEESPKDAAAAKQVKAPKPVAPGLASIKGPPVLPAMPLPIVRAAPALAPSRPQGRRRRSDSYSGSSRYTCSPS